MVREERQTGKIVARFCSSAFGYYGWLQLLLYSNKNRDAFWWIHHRTGCKSLTLREPGSLTVMLPFSLCSSEVR